MTGIVSTKRTSLLVDESVKFHAREFLGLKQVDLLHDYDLVEALGEGGFGLVYSCIHKGTGMERAVKILRKDPNRPHYNDNIVKEYNILKDLDHPNLVKVYDLYEDEEAFYIVTDIYAGGDVFDILEETGPLNEEDAAVVMNNLLLCVNYCHKRNLVHRDLKPENILLDGNRDYSDMKVIDFGLAKYLENFDDKIKGLVGSAYYVAPQVIEGEYTNKCDLWSCGVIAYALLSGFAPFDASTDELVLDVVYQGHYDFEDPEWDHISLLAKDFITQLLQYDEEDRLSAEEALKHPWLKRCRKSSRMNNALIRQHSRTSLRNLSNFTSKSNKLKQGACAMMASQLLPREEKEMIDKAFRSIDKTCDGQITRHDLNQSMADLMRDDFLDDSEQDGDGGLADDSDQSNRNCYVSAETAELVNSILEQVNISGSGAIQYSEFAVAMMVQKNLIDDSKMQACFNLFDRDNKGYITKDDLVEVLGLGNHAAQRAIDQSAGKGANRITLEQFKECILSKPEQEQRDSGAARKSKKNSLFDGLEDESSLDASRFRGPLGGRMDNSSRRPSVTGEESNGRRSSFGETGGRGRRTSMMGESSRMGNSSRRHPRRCSQRPSIMGRMSIVAKDVQQSEMLRALKEAEESCSSICLDDSKR